MTTIDRSPDAKPETQRRRRFTARDRKRLTSLYRRSGQTAAELASPYIRCKKCRFDDAMQHGF
jgi:hypothetical protein